MPPRHNFTPGFIINKCLLLSLIFAQKKRDLKKWEKSLVFTSEKQIQPKKWAVHQRYQVLFVEVIFRPNNFFFECSTENLILNISKVSVFRERRAKMINIFVIRKKRFATEIRLSVKKVISLPIYNWFLLQFTMLKRQDWIRQIDQGAKDLGSKRISCLPDLSDT